MKKALKITLATLGCIVAALLLIILALPLWIGFVVPPVANGVVPGVTETGFNMDAFGLNPYTGKVHVGATGLQNPARFLGEVKEEKKEPEAEKGLVSGLLSGVKDAAGAAVSAVGDVLSSPETNALTFASIDVKLSTCSLVTDTIHIEEIVVKDIYLYASAGLAANWREIIAAATKDSEPKEEEEPSSTKVVIDRISIEGLIVKFGDITVHLTDPIVITDIGKEEPADGEGAFDSIVTSICDAVEATSSVAGKGLKAAYSACKALVTGAGAITEGAGDVVSGAGDAVSSGVDAVKGLFGGSDK